MQIIRGDQIEFVPASHEDPARPGVLKRVLATKNDLMRGQVQMVNWSRLPADSSFRPHFHEDMQEVFVIVGGSVEMRVGDVQCQLRGGDAIVIDPREVHEMRNLGDQAVDYIVFGISTESGGKTIVVQ